MSVFECVWGASSMIVRGSVSFFDLLCGVILLFDTRFPCPSRFSLPPGEGGGVGDPSRASIPSGGAGAGDGSGAVPVEEFGAPRPKRRVSLVESGPFDSSERDGAGAGAGAGAGSSAAGGAGMASPMLQSRLKPSTAVAPAAAAAVARPQVVTDLDMIKSLTELMRVRCATLRGGVVFVCVICLCVAYLLCMHGCCWWLRIQRLVFGPRPLCIPRANL
jgi:hypothetical protein